jgi:hypothetical protein
MAEAIVKIDHIEINIKSEIFSEKFMKLIQNIENFNIQYNQVSNKISSNDYNFPLLVDLRNIETQKSLELFKFEEKDIFKLSDKDLITNTRKYLEICYRYGMEKFYRKKLKISDLVFDNQTIIPSNEIRNKIRRILYKCIIYISSDQFIKKYNGI